MSVTLALCISIASFLGAAEPTFPAEMDFLNQLPTDDADKVIDAVRQFALLQFALADWDKMQAGYANTNYDDVVDAWNYYVKNDNQGRGFILVGHSQGSSLITRLIQNEIEGKPIQKQMIAAYTPGTTLDRSRIVALIDEARLSGAAFAVSEFFRDDINVAAPVFDRRGAAIAAVGISVPVTRWTIQEVRKQLAPLVIETARTVSRSAAPHAALPIAS